MKGIIKLGFILTAYTVAACVGLAFVYDLTSSVIDQRQKSDLEAALVDLFPEADDFRDISGSLQSQLPQVRLVNEYLVLAAGEAIGIVTKTVGSSYGGEMTSLVGIGTDLKISGVKILENKDTPGLGANAGSPNYFVDRQAGLTFYGQFTGKSVQDRFEVNDDVIAITASTVTSKAVATSVKAAAMAVESWFTQDR